MLSEATARIFNVYLPRYVPLLENGDFESTEKYGEEPMEAAKATQYVQKLKRIIRFLVGFAVLLLTVVALLLLDARGNGALRTYLRRGRISSNTVAEIPITTTYFREVPEFSGPPSPETSAAWNSLLPPGRGYVFVPESSSYDLQPGEDSPWGPIYSVALFHQLHCLGMMRDRYWMLMETISSQPSSETLQALAQRLKGTHHINHCYDYIRQSLQCAGDMSLEWPREEEDGRRFVVDGWNIPHQCRSWDAIMEYMDNAHYNGSQRSDIA